jgi:hypothetical protein
LRWDGQANETVDRECPCLVDVHRERVVIKAAFSPKTTGKCDRPGAGVTFERGVKLESSPSAGTTSSIDDPMQASTWCSLVGVPPAREFFWRQIQAG